MIYLLVTKYNSTTLLIHHDSSLGLFIFPLSLPVVCLKYSFIHYSMLKKYRRYKNGWILCGHAHTVSCSPLDGNSIYTVQTYITALIYPIDVIALQSEARSQYWSCKRWRHLFRYFLCMCFCIIILLLIITLPVIYVEPNGQINLLGYMEKKMSSRALSNPPLLSLSVHCMCTFTGTVTKITATLMPKHM